MSLIYLREFLSIYMYVWRVLHFNSVYVFIVVFIGIVWWWWWWFHIQTTKLTVKYCENAYIYCCKLQFFLVSEQRSLLLATNHSSATSLMAYVTKCFNLMPVICIMLEYMVLFEFCALIVISENCFWYNFTESISVYKDILKYFPYKFSVDNPSVFFQEINRIWFSLYLKITLETTSQSEGVLH